MLKCLYYICRENPDCLNKAVVTVWGWGGCPPPCPPCSHGHAKRLQNIINAYPNSYLEKFQVVNSPQIDILLSTRRMKGMLPLCLSDLLKVTNHGIYLHAPEVWGALWGLETLSQILYRDDNDEVECFLFL